MGKKEDRIWGDGFDSACKIAKERGIEALLAEARMRGVLGIETRITSTDLDNMNDEIKRIFFQTIRIAFCSVLHDDFGFGEKRICRLFDGIDKLAAYMDRGWIDWVDLIDDINQRIGKDLSIACSQENLRIWQRPDDKDFYSETDFIDKDAWNARLNYLGLSDDGRQVTDRSGLWCWKYDDQYNKVRIYDELGGIALAVECLGAKRPGDDVTVEELEETRRQRMSDQPQEHMPDRRGETAQKPARKKRRRKRSA